jgi:hypothetical protein
LLHPDFGDAVVKEMTARGHRVTVRRPAEAPVMIRIDRSAQTIEAAGDPKARRHAGAY